MASNQAAVIISNYGGPEQLILSETDLPQLLENQVMVEVQAIGVNFIETYQRSGIYPVRLPFTPGQEFAGIVVEVGAAVTDIVVGDRITTCEGKAGYAKYAVVDADKAVKIPAWMNFHFAAALPLQGTTAHYLANSVFHIQPGSTALVHAGAGGVGQILIQLIVALGGSVIATASTPKKREIALQAGATKAVDYQDFSCATRKFTNGVGVDVVYDGVGKDTYLGSLASLRKRGVLALFGAASGPVPPLDPQLLNQAGSVYLTRPSLGDFMLSSAERTARYTDLFGAISSSKLKLTVSASYALREAPVAHTDLEARKSTGKFILLP